MILRALSAAWHAANRRARDLLAGRRSGAKARMSPLAAAALQHRMMRERIPAPAPTKGHDPEHDPKP